MALYEYKCKECGKISEILVFSSDEIPKCKECGSTKLEKMLSGFAVSKGSSTSNTPMPSCPTGGCCYGGNCGLN